MSTDFRWGILASGGIAQAFARDLSYFNNHIVAAVGSRSQESADAFATEFPGCVWSTTLVVATLRNIGTERRERRTWRSYAVVTKLTSVAESVLGAAI